MDPIVIQAMAKWPNVPHCYGWLGLDARGNWYMRDDRAQAAGPFQASRGGNLASRGSLLKHEKLIDFIGRNYACDDAGQWFFQNGPQRVYLELEVTPWVWRLSDAPVSATETDVGTGTTQRQVAVYAHTGQLVQVRSCLLDELGRVYLATDRGLGLVHTQDMELAANAIDAGQWHPEAVQSASLAQSYGFEVSPAIKNKSSK